MLAFGERFANPALAREFIGSHPAFDLFDLLGVPSAATSRAGPSWSGTSRSTGSCSPLLVYGSSRAYADVVPAWPRLTRRTLRERAAARA